MQRGVGECAQYVCHVIADNSRQAHIHIVGKKREERREIVLFSLNRRDKLWFRCKAVALNGRGRCIYTHCSLSFLSSTSVLSEQIGSKHPYLYTKITVVYREIYSRMKNVVRTCVEFQMICTWRCVDRLFKEDVSNVES